MAINSILVFGATGTQGHPVVEAALEAGLEVRAATRDVAEAAEKLSSRVEVVKADLLDSGEVEMALDGVDAVFFHLPQLPEDSDPAELVDNVVRGAAARSLERVIFTTGAYCGDELPEGELVGSLRALSRQVLDGKVPAVVLRPTLYLANLVWPHLIRQIREYGQLTYPPLDSRRRLNWTATEDQGRIAVACLEADVAGESIDIGSPEPVNGPELCRMLAAVYGREVHYAPQSIDEFADAMTHLSGSAHIARMVAELYASIDALEGDGPLVDTDMLEKRLGVELTPVSQWIEDRLGYLIELYG